MAGTVGKHDPLRDLAPEARALVEQVVATNGGPLGPAEYLDSMLRAGSRIENGTFTVIALHGGLSLAELDLRPFRALVEVSANAVGWSRKFSRVLLGEQPRLKKLRVGSHGLSAIDLSGCRALEDVDVSYGALTSLVLPEGAPLEILNATSNALHAIDLSRHRALARLELMDNRIHELELGAHAELRGVICAGNPLQRLVLPIEAPLAKLSVSRCPLGALDVRRLARLQTLFCDEASLDALDLSSSPALTQLSCDDNRLASLDLSHTPRLASVSAQRNPLASLDVRALASLTSLRVDAAVTVQCTEGQKRSIPELRARFGIEKHAKVAEMDLWELDQLARHHNWDDGVKKLQTIVEHPGCDLGTALTIYWLGQPEELADYETPAQAPKDERAVVKLLRTIEARVARDDFATRLASFPGADTEGTKIPAVMGRKVP